MLLETIGAVSVTVVTLGALYRRHLAKSWGAHDTTNEIDANGKTVLITGGNSGLGKECAFEMAKRGATVIIASRDMNLSKKAIEDIRSVTSSGQLIAMQLDLGSLQSIREFADNFKKKFDQIHILVNNAGVSAPLKKRLKTQDGFEFNMGVNHLGHFLLTNLLLDRVKKASPSRIVVVASALSEKANLSLDDILLETEDPNTSKVNAYANSKFANILFSKELSSRLVGTGVSTYALCPGWVKTNLFRYSDLNWWKYVLAVPVVLLFMRTPRQGVQTILHCSLSKAVGSESGQVYRNCGKWATKTQFTDEMANRLWLESEKLVGLKKSH